MHIGIILAVLADKYRRDCKKKDEPEDMVKQEVTSTALPSSAYSYVYTPLC